MQNPISITALSSLSAIGSNPKQIWKHYLNNNHFISRLSLEKGEYLVAQLSDFHQQEIAQLKKSNSKYKNLDASVLYAIFASRKAIAQAGWNKSDDFGVNLGSSRGATTLFEKYHQSFLENNKSETLSSPTTTLGNISSWVAQDLQTNGPEISHSITCSSALHAVLNGVAWLQSGMVDKFLVGGSEAPLTPFTIAQMQALKVYSKSTAAYPCQALNLQKTENTMVIGEGAAIACLEKGIQKNAIAHIEGIGYATEILQHNVSISTNAECMQKAMQKAIKNINPTEVDVVVTHTPGTIKGDIAEINAIKAVFGHHQPAITTNKWKVGHTFATSGMLSMEMAILMLQHQQFIGVPYLENQKHPKQIKKILINAVGFGGNAVSVLLSKPQITAQAVIRSK